MARRNQSPVPMRRCVGCMESKEKEKLIRICFDGENLMVDYEGVKPGRGCYLCKGSKDCLDKAIKKKSFNRTYRTQISSFDSLLELYADKEETNG